MKTVLSGLWDFRTRKASGAAGAGTKHRWVPEAGGCPTNPACPGLEAREMRIGWWWKPEAKKVSLRANNNIAVRLIQSHYHFNSFLLGHNSKVSSTWPLNKSAILNHLNIVETTYFNPLGWSEQCTRLVFRYNKSNGKILRNFWGPWWELHQSVTVLNVGAFYSKETSIK